MFSKNSPNRAPLTEDRIKGSYGIGIGMLMFGGLGLIHLSVSQFVLWMLLVPAMAIFVPGCAFYARSKGYPLFLGLIGLLALPGLVLLILLPDRNDKTYQETMELQRLLRERHEAKQKQKAGGE